MTTSRRALLRQSIRFAAIGALPAAMTALPRIARAQTSPTVEYITGGEPAIDIGTGARIAQITIVTQDAKKRARRFSDIFGVSWQFFDYRPIPITANGASGASSAPTFRLAISHFGGRTFRLVEPVSGKSAYSDFLERQGEGFFSISLPARGDHDKAVLAFQKAGVAVAMQAANGDGSRFTIFDSVEDFGVRIELIGLGNAAVIPSAMKPTGSYVPKGPPVVDMNYPVEAGGRVINHIGTVVKSARHCAQRYAEVLGVRAWSFRTFKLEGVKVYGKELSAEEMPSAHVNWGGTFIGDMLVECIEPMPEKPGGIHRRFFDKHWPGNGFQHTGISPMADRETLQALERQGITAEATYRTGPPGSGMSSYIGMEDQLAGFVVEF